mmetsp:Transcript_10466/g.18286  ORF Transcript_10466/g.18286 Transcript_10466/m.18286 type:complete len:223 (+) Transcript_10466:577-1245(+)
MAWHNQADAAVTEPYAMAARAPELGLQEAQTLVPVSLQALLTSTPDSVSIRDLICLHCLLPYLKLQHVSNLGHIGHKLKQVELAILNKLTRWLTLPQDTPHHQVVILWVCNTDDTFCLKGWHEYGTVLVAETIFVHPRLMPELLVTQGPEFPWWLMKQGVSSCGLLQRLSKSAEVQTPSADRAETLQGQFGTGGHSLASEAAACHTAHAPIGCCQCRQQQLG